MNSATTQIDFRLEKSKVRRDTLGAMEGNMWSFVELISFAVPFMVMTLCGRSGLKALSREGGVEVAREEFWFLLFIGLAMLLGAVLLAGFIGIWNVLFALGVLPVQFPNEGVTFYAIGFALFVCGAVMAAVLTAGYAFKHRSSKEEASTR
jgi:hypothetical protein